MRTEDQTRALFGQLPWSQATQPEGTVIAIPVEQDASWYVDLMTTRRR